MELGSGAATDAVKSFRPRAQQIVEIACRRLEAAIGTPKKLGVFGGCSSGRLFARIRGQGPWAAMVFGTAHCFGSGMLKVLGSPGREF